MKISTVVTALLAAMATIAPPVSAATALFAIEAGAAQACGADEVVWVDLDRGRFYHKGQAAYGKNSNGGYACVKNAHSQYREGHE
jgi:hypothetical protein